MPKPTHVLGSGRVMEDVSVGLVLASLSRGINPRHVGTSTSSRSPTAAVANRTGSKLRWTPLHSVCRLPEAFLIEVQYAPYLHLKNSEDIESPIYPIDRGARSAWQRL